MMFSFTSGLDPRRGVVLALALALGAATVAPGCGAGEGDGTVGDGGGATIVPKDRPIAGLSTEQKARFADGDNLFDLPLRDADGLGPLYTRDNCGACHGHALRGPGLVQKMSVVDADGAPSPDQSKLPFGHTVHPLTTAGATTPILPPMGDPTVKLSVRMGPPVAGRGYMEAVADAEIERMEMEQAARADGIHGRANHVVFSSEPNPDSAYDLHQNGDMVIGRFGLKARIATLDEFTADALQNDMGITTVMRPTEFLNPDGLTDDDKPGTDIQIDSVNARADYMRMLEIPRPAKLAEKGRAVFESTLCSVCHAPSLKTRADYPLAPLAGIDAPVYTDFLLHDMGAALADGMNGQDGEAESGDWRTAPLIGEGLLKSYLHDGRAKTLDDAIRLHGGDGSEARESESLYEALSDPDRNALLDFVGSL